MNANVWLWVNGNPIKEGGGTISHPNLALIERLQPERITAMMYVPSSVFGEHERLQGTYAHGSASMEITRSIATGPGSFSCDVDFECVDPDDGKRLYEDFLAGKARPVDIFGGPQYRPTALVARELVVAVKDLVVELWRNARNGIRKGFNWILRK